MHNPIVVLYCGSHFAKALLDKVLYLGCTPILIPSNTATADILALGPRGIIVTGSGSYLADPKAERVDPGIYECGVPVLGICYGMQLMAADLGGRVKRMLDPEREMQHLRFEGAQSELYSDFTPEGAPVWMVHTCKVTEIPGGFRNTGSTKITECASMEDVERGLYGVQFHPEHKGNQAGTAILWRFLHDICGC